MPDLKIFLWIAASVADAVAVNPNGAKTLLANSVSTLPMKTIQEAYLKVLLTVSS